MEAAEEGGDLLGPLEPLLHVGLVVLWTQATQKMSRIHLTPAKDPFTMFWREHSLAIVVS